MNPYSRIIRYKLQGLGADDLNQVGAPSPDAASNFVDFSNSHPEYQQGAPSGRMHMDTQPPPDVQEWQNQMHLKQQKKNIIRPPNLINGPARNLASEPLSPWKRLLSKEPQSKDVFSDPSPPQSFDATPAMQQYINFGGPGNPNLWERQIKALEGGSK